MGIVLLIISAAAGYCLLKQFSRSEKPVVSFCGAIVIGFTLSGTLLYVLDLLLVKLFHDFFSGTLIFLIAATLYIIYSYRRQNILALLRSDASSLWQDRFACFSAALFLLFSLWLNWNSLSLTANGNILVANGAWSDLMYHLSYLRSVGLGNNVPIQYPYFANEPIRYHFMFDFFAGKVVQLGLDSVQALNLLSTAGLFSLLMLVFEFGRSFFKSALTGFLGSVFLLFHSSLSVFPWIQQNSHNLLSSVVEKDGWLTGAPFEQWGLFNLNVFVNQRHFAMGLAALVLLVILVLDLSDSPVVSNHLEQNGNHRRLGLPLLMALLLGCLPFWNALFAATGVIVLLAFAALNFRNRSLCYQLLATAAVAGLIIYPQLMLFKGEGSALAGYPRFHLGYALDHFAVLGFLGYYLRIFGVKVLLIFVSLILLDRKSRLYALVFLLPFAIANMLQFSSVLYDNNKLMFASLVFLNSYAAYTIAYLVKRRNRLFLGLAIVLTLSATLAGVVDFFAVKNLKQSEIADNSSSLKWWVVYKTEPRAVFLTNVFIPYADSALNAVSLAGRYLYVVRNCVSSSCFVDGRIENARKIYSFSGGVAAVRSLLQQEKIDYVLVDEHVRNNPQLGLNERAFIENFKIVYKDESATIFSPK